MIEKINHIREHLFIKMDGKIEGVDLLLLLLLDVITFEIRKNKSISDKTAEALIQIVSFQSTEYYYHGGFLELDSELKNLMYALYEYNEKLKEYELDVIGVEPENWSNYFKERIETLLNNWDNDN